MFSNLSQTSSPIELFSASGKNPGKNWRSNGGGIHRVYDRTIKGFVFLIDKGIGTNLQAPANGKDVLGIYQRYLLFQIRCSVSKPLSIEITVSDRKGQRHRLHLSTKFRCVDRNELHTQIPLDFEQKEKWNNFIFDLKMLANVLFPGEDYHSLDSICIHPVCRIRKILTIPSLEESDNKIPESIDFPNSVDYITQIFHLSSEPSPHKSTIPTLTPRNTLSQPPKVLGAPSHHQDQYVRNNLRGPSFGNAGAHHILVDQDHASDIDRRDVERRGVQRDVTELTVDGSPHFPPHPSPTSQTQQTRRYDFAHQYSALPSPPPRPPPTPEDNHTYTLLPVPDTGTSPTNYSPLVTAPSVHDEVRERYLSTDNAESRRCAAAALSNAGPKSITQPRSPTIARPRTSHNEDDINREEHIGNDDFLVQLVEGRAEDGIFDDTELPPLASASPVRQHRPIRPLQSQSGEGRQRYSRGSGTRESTDEMRLSNSLPISSAASPCHRDRAVASQRGITFTATDPTKEGEEDCLDEVQPLSPFSRTSLFHQSLIEDDEDEDGVEMELEKRRMRELVEALREANAALSTMEADYALYYGDSGGGIAVED